MRAHRRTASPLACLLMTAALGVSGCVAGDWNAGSVPAAGVQIQAGTVKVLNLMIISDEAGQAIVSGAVSSAEPIEFDAVAISATSLEGEQAEASLVELSTNVAAGELLLLDGQNMAFTDPNLQVGLTAHVTLFLGNSQTLEAQAPIVSAEHDDYAQAWAEAYQA